MNEKQLKLLDIYRENWVKLSAAEAVIDDIRRYIQDLQRDQRQLANKIATIDLAARNGVPSHPDDDNAMPALG